MAGIKAKWMASLRVFLFLAGAAASAQSLWQPGAAEKIFGGSWVSSETTRRLEISFGEGPHATILDWTPRFQKRESGDVYKAAVAGSRLVMAEDPEYHVTYSEILVKNDTLTYRTRSLTRGREATCFLVSIWET